MRKLTYYLTTVLISTLAFTTFSLRAEAIDIVTSGVQTVVITSNNGSVNLDTNYSSDVKVFQNNCANSNTIATSQLLDTLFIDGGADCDLNLLIPSSMGVDVTTTNGPTWVYGGFPVIKVTSLNDVVPPGWEDTPAVTINGEGAPTVDVFAKTGDISIKNINQNVSATTEKGLIDVINCKGEFQIHSGKGGIYGDRLEIGVGTKSNFISDNGGILISKVSVAPNPFKLRPRVKVSAKAKNGSVTLSKLKKGKVTHPKHATSIIFDGKKKASVNLKSTNGMILFLR
jgi:hypothetical protein